MLASADVKHLYGTTVHHAVPSTGFGTVSSSGFADYVKPTVITTGQYVANHHGHNYGQIPTFTSGSSYNHGSSGYSGAYNSYGGAVNSAHFQDTQSHPTLQHRTTLVKQTAPIVSKSSYVFTAPDEDEIVQHDQTIVIPRPRQHYKVVFIKAPSSTIINTPSTAVGGTNQEKTLIYVVSDKKRIENHIENPAAELSKPQQPEVFFIKNNKPTEVVHSKVQYQTVDAIQGAENGAVNGVPNKLAASSTGVLEDEPTSNAQANFAQNIVNTFFQGGSGIVQGGTGIGQSYINQFVGLIPNPGATQPKGRSLEPTEHEVTAENTFFKGTDDATPVKEFSDFGTTDVKTPVEAVAEEKYDY